MSETEVDETKTVNCVVTGEPGDPAKMVLLPCVTGSGTRSFVPTMHPFWGGYEPRPNAFGITREDIERISLRHSDRSPYEDCINAFDSPHDGAFVGAYCFYFSQDAMMWLSNEEMELGGDYAYTYDQLRLELSRAEAQTRKDIAHPWRRRKTELWDIWCNGKVHYFGAKADQKRPEVGPTPCRCAAGEARGEPAVPDTEYTWMRHFLPPKPSAYEVMVRSSAAYYAKAPSAPLHPAFFLIYPEEREAPPNDVHRDAVNSLLHISAMINRLRLSHDDYSPKYKTKEAVTAALKGDVW